MCRTLDSASLFEHGQALATGLHDRALPRLGMSAPTVDALRQTLQTLQGLPWFIKTADGRTFSGRLDENGQLPRVITENEQDYETLWGEEALEHMTAAS
jgi:small nuclear ribonucleoprotein (snRNP)-like protein